MTMPENMTEPANHLFLISVGGSGTRVVESLVHMLAISGSTQTWPQDIHILVMEMDEGNGNLERFKTLVGYYEKLHQIREGLSGVFPGFAPNLHPYFWFPTSERDVTDQTMQSMVNSDPNAALLSKLLYTENEMGMRIDMGFKGRPAVGVAYFKQLSQGDMDMKQEAANHTAFYEFFHAAEEAKAKQILVISSCHGGTGATGIPVLERILHQQLPNHPDLGLLLMLPTFRLPAAPADATTGIDSDSFNDKVKTVLSYYAAEKLLCAEQGRGYKWTFLLGYPDLIPFDRYSEGKKSQENPATFFDWYACAAIKRFYDGGFSQDFQPGIYISYLDHAPWDFARFHKVFPHLAEDATIMLQVANAYQEAVLPALSALCLKEEKRDGRRGSRRMTLKECYTKYPFLDEFFPETEAQLGRTEIEAEYKTFSSYLTAYVTWLYEILSHIPTGYPEAPDLQRQMHFHGLSERDQRRLRRTSFGDEKPEHVQSLVFQTFVRAPFLYRLMRDAQASWDIPGKDDDDYMLLQILKELSENARKAQELNAITAVQATPSIRVQHILGYLWETCQQEDLTGRINEKLGRESDSVQAVWLLLVSLMQTVRRYYVFRKEENHA